MIQIWASPKFIFSLGIRYLIGYWLERVCLGIMLKLSCVLAGTELLMTCQWCFWANFVISRGEGGNSDPENLPIVSNWFSHLLQVFSLHFTTLNISISSPVVGCLQDPFLRTNNRGCPLPTSNRQSKWLSLMILTASSTKSVSFLIRTSGKYYTQADLTFRPTPTFF